MLTNGVKSYNGVAGFTDAQIIEMRAFIQGAVYCWCKNRKDEWFAARDLFGGDNYYWEGTPLYMLYKYYSGEKEEYSEYAVAEAGKAVGRLLKGVIIEDKRKFDIREGYTLEYRWTGEE